MRGQDLVVSHVLFAPGQGGFFYDDQAAIRAGAVTDGFTFKGKPKTAGFSCMRQPADSLGIGLVLSDGAVVWGDMMGVQYAGIAGRDPVFETKSIEQITRRRVLPRLNGLSVASFREACEIGLAPVSKGLPPAVSYGVSQALLQASAHARRCTMVEVICREFDLPVVAKAVPLYAQSGDQRFENVDKMILRGADVLPHGLINSREKFGIKGETFLEYAKWVAARVRALGVMFQ